MQEVSLDGVIYARFEHNGQTWLLGSTNPSWKALVGTLQAVPDEADLIHLAGQGIWLGPVGQSCKLAVMCCGLGSGWPGMGRSLYDNFPAARKAMDYLADIAGWDILGLMDETDLETISQTRKQIPYLFMLEYAQWMQFVSLGISPAIMCGHSLGELIALCLAGVYDEKAAWLLFEKRAEHITKLEKKSANETGMLAVHAEESIINATLAQWPSLALANRNTKQQFILGGPKPDLMAARKSLRRQRIPALMINVPLAFHNPAMRILRDFSIRRLKALEMHHPRVPVISNVTAGFYPESQEEICRFIVDLDENAVAWNECALAMWNRDHTDIFLELGPAETLCGLMEEIIPESTSIPCDHRLRETDAMRMACARLFALGLLDFDKIVSERKSRPGTGQASCESQLPLVEEIAPVPVDSEIEKVLEIVAKACGRETEKISPEMDLRYDLGMRSSSFPRILQEVEKKLGVSAEFERMLNVSTAGDLALALLGRAGQPLAKVHSKLSRAAIPPFRRFILRKDAVLSAKSSLLYYSPEPAILPGKNDVILFCIHDAEFMPQLWSGFAPEDCILVMPHPLAEKCAHLDGYKIESFDIPEDPEEYKEIPARVYNRFGRLDGVFFIPASYPAIDRAKGIHHLSPEFVESLETLNPNAWIAVMRRFAVRDEGPRNFLAAYSAWIDSVDKNFAGPGRRIFAIADDGKKISPDELGDLAVLELMFGLEAAFWSRTPLFEGDGPIPQYFAEAKFFPLALPDKKPELPQIQGLFQGISWWSVFADTGLAPNSDKDNKTGKNFEFQLPASCKLMAMLQGAKRLFPWLSPLGFSDIHFYEPLNAPFGVARECRLECRSMFWLRHEKVMTRMVETVLMPRLISANGRRLNEYKTTAKGVCLLGGSPVHTLPIPDVIESTHEDIAPEYFYDAAGIDNSMRMVKKLWLADVSSRSFGGILLTGKTSIALGEEWDYYATLLQMFDSLLQAVLMVLANPQAPDKFLVQWKCAGVGYLNFDSNWLSSTDDLYFYLKPVWLAENFIRFNAQVADSAGRIFLVAYNIEFDRA